MTQHLLDLTGHWAGYAALAVFILAYALVVGEESLRLRKSKPVMIAAGILWVLVAVACRSRGDTHTAGEAFRHTLLDFAEVFLFVLASMTYVNTMEELGVFQALRAWLVTRRFSPRTVFWITGVLAFFISAVVNNLTTALLMATVVIAVGAANSRFIVVGCINVVVAANAGGAFSPFGDITTLMVWQKGVVQFQEFFALFVPALVNWLVPAALMAFAVPPEKLPLPAEKSELQAGAITVVVLFAITIALSVIVYHAFQLPPVLGMMTGLGMLKVYGYCLKTRPALLPREPAAGPEEAGFESASGGPAPRASPRAAFDTFKVMERTEWDTLMFFYGIILCVGALGTLGYVALASRTLYGNLGPTIANVGMGVLSAVIDNIPLMFAVLTVNPDMSLGQWLLITLAVGVGGSLLSIGSAAGVAVMGQARGVYTFRAHLRWSWAIALGYAAGIWAHFLLNADLIR